jgi:hypothetical protein
LYYPYTFYVFMIFIAEKIIQKQMRVVVVTLFVGIIICVYTPHVFAATPTVTTDAASNTTSTSTTLNGSVTSTGGSPVTYEGFEYGWTTSYGFKVATTTSGDFGTGSFSATVSNLTCNKTYHYHFIAVNAEGTSTGIDQTFTTGNTDATCGTVTFSVNDYGIQSLGYNGTNVITSPVNGYGDAIKYVGGVFEAPDSSTSSPNSTAVPVVRYAGSSYCPTTKTNEQCYQHIYRTGLNDSFTLTVEFSTYDNRTVLADIYVTNNDSTDTMTSFSMGYWLGFVMHVPDLAPYHSYGTFNVQSNNPTAYVPGYNWGGMVIYTDDYSKKFIMTTSNTYDTSGNPVPPTNSGLIWTFRLYENIAPGQTYHFPLYIGFGDSTYTAQSATQLAPDAYTAFQQAPDNQLLVHWPNRAPVSQWFIAEGAGHSSTINPRAYLWNTALDVSNQATFNSQVLSTADHIISMMNTENPRPQAIDIWDLEGEEMGQPFTYVGYPNKLHDLAPEMDAVADQLFKKFRDAGYDIALTLRPSDFMTGTLADMPSTCTSNATKGNLRDVYIATDANYPYRGYECTSTNNWIQVGSRKPNHQHFSDNDANFLANLESKVSYARARWGVHMYYIDSTVYSGGSAFNYEILRQLQTDFPDCIFFPENINTNDYSASAPYIDARPGASTSGYDIYSAARDMYPLAFGIITNVDDYYTANKSTFITSVQHGNLFYYNNAWYTTDGTVEQMMQDAGYTPGPLVAFTSPSNGATVSGAAVSLTASSSYYLFSGVKGVQFFLDGQSISPLITATTSTSTYTYSWDSTTVASGDHTLSAVSSDYIGNYATTSISVTVSNGQTPPGVIASTTSDISSSTATISAQVIASGGSSVTQSGFAYGTSATLTTGVSTTTLGAQSVGMFMQSLIGLTPGMTYYYRPYTVNTNGTSTGNISSFTTDPLRPLVSTVAPEANSGSTIIVHGNIDNTQGSNATVRGFVYGTSIEYATTSVGYGATTTESGSFGTGSYSETLTGLSCNTTYYVVAYATNAHGTGYGSMQSTTTGACSMSTVTATSSAVTYSTATLSGLITDDGNASSTVVGFQWGTTTTYDNTKKSVGIFGVSQFVHDLTGLMCNTTYHYRSFTQTFAGTASSSDQTFTTGTCPADTTAPIITALSVSTTSNSLTLTINSFTATDNTGVTGYLINESATTPSATDSAWLATAPTSYTFGGAGTKTIYAWTKDAAGNISAATSTSVTVTAPTTSQMVSSSGGGGGGGGGSAAVGTLVLTTTGSGIGTTTSNPSGVLCAQGVCTASFSLGTTLTLIATPASSSHLTSWSGCDNINGLTCTITLSAYVPRNLTVTYDLGVTQGSVTNKNLTPVAGAPADCTPASVTTFNRSLTLGSTGTDVKNLQIFLNAHDFTISTSGAGSPGNETDFFGPATKRAVIAFQEYYATEVLVPYHLTSGTGFVGPSTLRELNALASNIVGTCTTTATPTTVATPLTSSATVGTLTDTLSLGDRSSQVIILQKFLNTKGYTVSSSGAGSPGNETDYFGTHTLKALQAFQCATLKICSGSSTTNGYGLVGPHTRAVLNGKTYVAPIQTSAPQKTSPATETSKKTSIPIVIPTIVF